MGKTLLIIFLSIGLGIRSGAGIKLIPENRPRLAPVIQSLIIPGLGEFALQKPTRGRIFFLTENVLWISAIGSYMIASMDETKYKAFASEHAGVQVNGKDQQFWIDIGNYMSTETYNEEHLRWREIRNLYPKTRASRWQWDSSQNQHRFEKMRINSDRWALIGKFIIGGIVINHLVSAIDVLYLERLQTIEKVTMTPLYNPNLDQLSFQCIIHL